MALYKRIMIALIIATIWLYTIAEAACVRDDSSIAVLQRETGDPLRFCRFWIDTAVETEGSPLSGLSARNLSEACRCVLGVPAWVSTTTSSFPAVARATGPCGREEKQVVSVRNAFIHPARFCSYYNLRPRENSPLQDVRASRFSSVCSCAARSPTILKEARLAPTSSIRTTSAAITTTTVLQTTSSVRISTFSSTSTIAPPTTTSTIPSTSTTAISSSAVPPFTTSSATSTIESVITEISSASLADAAATTSATPSATASQTISTSSASPFFVHVNEQHRPWHYQYHQRLDDTIKCFWEQFGLASIGYQFPSFKYESLFFCSVYSSFHFDFKVDVPIVFDKLGSLSPKYVLLLSVDIFYIHSTQSSIVISIERSGHQSLAPNININDVDFHCCRFGFFLNYSDSNFSNFSPYDSKHNECAFHDIDIKHYVYVNRHILFAFKVLIASHFLVSVHILVYHSDECNGIFELTGLILELIYELVAIHFIHNDDFDRPSPHSDTQDYWSDLRLTRSTSIRACINACALVPACQAAVYVKQGATGDCFFSSTADRARGPFPSNIVAFSAERAPGQSCVSTSAAVCPQADLGFYRNPNGVSYKVYCGVAYQTNVLEDLGLYQNAQTFVQCLQVCDATLNCIGISFAYGPLLGTPQCRLKGARTNPILSLTLGYNVDSAFLARDTLRT
ncbi:Hypothetical protein D9617_13g099490 [Elsinoe fawcettii]|nr:Hypothetical protein D9617_13g099490 [Elsinoe fawcettii]